MPISILPQLLGSLPPQTPPIQPLRREVHLLLGSMVLLTAPIPGAGREVGARRAPPAPLFGHGYQGHPREGAVLPQLAKGPPSQRVGFGKKREGHVKARPEGVHRGAGLGHHRLSQLEDPEARGGVETEDQMVLAPIPLWGHRLALSRRGVGAEDEDEEAGLCSTGCVVAGALDGSQDLAWSLRDGSDRRVHEHLEATTSAPRGIKASSPGAAAATGGPRRLKAIFQELPRLGETLQQLCVQPVGPALGGPCLASGGLFQAENWEDS